jgi:acyl carrier protein
MAPQDDPDVNEFVQLLRLYLPEAEEEVSLVEAQNLYDLGLDSLKAIQLVFDLEEKFGVTFEADVLNSEIFTDSRELWTRVCSLSR